MNDFRSEDVCFPIGKKSLVANKANIKIHIAIYLPIDIILKVQSKVLEKICEHTPKCLDIFN